MYRQSWISSEIHSQILKGTLSNLVHLCWLAILLSIHIYTKKESTFTAYYKFTFTVYGSKCNYMCSVCLFSTYLEQDHEGGIPCTAVQFKLCTYSIRRQQNGCFSRAKGIFCQDVFLNLQKEQTLQRKKVLGLQSICNSRKDTPPQMFCFAPPPPHEIPV